MDRAGGVDADSRVDSGELVSVKPGFSVPLSDQNSVALKTLRSWQVATPMRAAGKKGGKGSRERAPFKQREGALLPSPSTSTELKNEAPPVRCQRGNGRTRRAKLVAQQ